MVRVGKTISRIDTFYFPKAGFIFTPRKNATRSHLHYHAVYDHVRRQAPLFYKHLQEAGEQVDPIMTQLRPHSGRATLITELMGEGMVTAMSMKYARHAPGSFKVHVGYSRITLSDVKDACDKLSSLRKRKVGSKGSSYTTKQLLALQKDINAELRARA